MRVEGEGLVFKSRRKIAVTTALVREPKPLTWLCYVSPSWGTKDLARISQSSSI